MEFPIFADGAQVGSLTVTRDGLYWQLDAICRPQPGGVTRLYGAPPDGAPQRLGVFVPEGAQLHLTRKIAARQLLVGDGWTFSCRRPERAAQIAGHRVPGGEIVTEHGVRRLYVPYQPGQPFALMEYVCFFTFSRQKDTWYWMCALNDENCPIFVDKPLECDTIKQVS